MLSDWDEYLMECEVGGYVGVGIDMEMGSGWKAMRSEYERLQTAFMDPKCTYLVFTTIYGNEVTVTKKIVEHIAYITAAYVEKEHESRRNEAFKGD